MLHCSNANHDVFEEEGDSTTTDAKKAQVVYPRNQNYKARRHNRSTHMMETSVP